MTEQKTTEQTSRSERAMAHHPAGVSPSLKWVPPPVKMAQPPHSLPTSHVVMLPFRKITVLSLGSQESKVAVHDVTRTSSKAHMLQCAAICKCESCHPANASLKKVLKITRAATHMKKVIAQHSNTMLNTEAGKPPVLTIHATGCHDAGGYPRLLHEWRVTARR